MGTKEQRSRPVSMSSSICKERVDGAKVKEAKKRKDCSNAGTDQKHFSLSHFPGKETDRFWNSRIFTKY